MEKVFIKRLFIVSLVVLIPAISLYAGESSRKNKRSRNDSLNYIEVEGKLKDGITSSPVVFASVYVNGSNIATVTNIDGEFVLKTPKGKEDSKVTFTHLGYENVEMRVSDMIGRENIIEMKAVALPIDEVVIRGIDPEELLLKALEKINKNYSNVPEMQISFYRETIKQNKKYVAVSEAVLDIYKSSYSSTFDNDRVKIYKGRKSADVKKMDTLIVKLQGGPRTSLLLDIVKNSGFILDKEVFEYYNFELAGLTTINDRETYVIRFEQKEDIELPLFNGHIYIDKETVAISGLDFNISEQGLPYASKYLVRKKPASLKVDVNGGHYLVKYRVNEGRWYLDYIRSELVFTSKWKKRFFKSKFDIMLEMAVTDRTKENVEKFRNKESAKLNDVLAEQVKYFEDDNFWGDYNTIKPDESIEIAIKKLSRKLKR